MTISFLRRIIPSLPFAGFLFFGMAEMALAGAWTRDKGDIQLITTALYYSTDSRITNNGDRVSQPRYTKYELNPYIEYGLTDAWTVGASLFLQHLNDSNDTTYGIANTELFARRQLYRDDRYALAVQPVVKLPSPQRNSGPPAIGNRYADVGAHLIGGVNFALFDRLHYAELDIGYRIRTGHPEDQLMLNATLGLRVSDRLILLNQLFQTWRVDAPRAVSFTQSPRDDYSLTKIQFSGLYELTPGQAVQAGAFYHLDGRNTGGGGGVLLSYWRQF